MWFSIIHIDIYKAIQTLAVIVMCIAVIIIFFRVLAIMILREVKPCLGYNIPNTHVSIIESINAY